MTEKYDISVSLNGRPLGYWEPVQVERQPVPSLTRLERFAATTRRPRLRALADLLLDLGINW